MASGVKCTRLSKEGSAISAQDREKVVRSSQYQPAVRIGLYAEICPVPAAPDELDETSSRPGALKAFTELAVRISDRVDPGKNAVVCDDAILR